jgi:DNA primase
VAKTLLEVLSGENIQTFESSEGRSVAHCPFHKGDREPSFTIYPNDTYWCFGCRVWGNPVKFLVDYKGLSSKEAMEIVGVDYEFPKSEKRAIKVKNIFKTGKFLYEVAVIYHNYLMSQRGPQKYLEDRGLTQETIKKYLLGYTDGAVLQCDSAYEYELANEVGLLSKSGAEALSHRIVIPNVIDNAYVDFMTGRTVINDRIKYLGLRMPKPLCGFYESRNSPILFLVEGNFDYLILRQWGYPAIVMSGAHISKPNYTLLQGRTIVVVPDNDDTGMKAAREVKKTMPTSIVLDYSKLGAKDIGELAVKPNAEQSFGEIVREALWDTPLLNPTWSKYLPTSIDLIPSLSI